MEHAHFVQDELAEFVRGDQLDRYSDQIDPTQYVGWATISSWDPVTRKVFTQRTVDLIKKQVCHYLEGVDPQGRHIVPSDKVVMGALYGVYENHIPRTGDIYGKFLVVDQTQQDDFSYIVDKTISLLVCGIRTDIGMVEANSKLTIWTTILGDFNEHGLRQYAPLKMRKRGPDRMLFHMKY